MTANGQSGAPGEAWAPRRPEEGFMPPGPGEVQVWRIAVDRPPQPAAALEGLLPPGERERAAGIRARAGRGRFVVARGSLRLILGGMLGMPPREVPLVAGARGKPEIAAEARESGLRFNVAHSGALVLLAVARGREVGVDVELIREGIDYAAVTARFLGSGAGALLELVPDRERRREFFRLWCRAEAIVKARGSGWSGAKGQLDADPGLTGAPDRAVVDLAPGAGYAGAVAAEGSGWRPVRLDLGRPAAPPPDRR